MHLLKRQIPSAVSGTVCLLLFFSHVPLKLQVLVTQPMIVTMGSIAKMAFAKLSKWLVFASTLGHNQRQL